MKRKSALVFLELAVLLLVLAVAGALCLQAFTKAELRSREIYCQDRAMATLQNAAEILQHSRGDLSDACDVLGGVVEKNVWRLFLDENWAVSSQEREYCLEASPEPCDTPLLGSVRLTLTDATGREIACLSVHYQEVRP